MSVLRWSEIRPQAGTLVPQMWPTRHIRNFVPWGILDSAQSASNSRQTNPIGTKEN
jgi:hypothetical protein